MPLQNWYISRDCKYLKVGIMCRVNTTLVLCSIFLARDQNTFCILKKQEFSVSVVHRQLKSLWYQTLASLEKNLGLGKKEKKKEKSTSNLRKSLVLFQEPQERLKVKIGLSISGNAYGFTHPPAFSGELVTSTGHDLEAIGPSHLWLLVGWPWKCTWGHLGHLKKGQI